jgi:host factor-I protein
MGKGVSFQDGFLNTLRKERVFSTIFTVNGFQIKKARILGFDTYVVVVESEGKQMLLYKHAISSIVPEKPIKLAGEGKEE